MSIRRAVLRLVSPCLPFAVLLSFAVSAAPPPAAGPQGTPASVAPKVAGPLSPAQRGQLVRQFVLKWGNHVNRIYGVPVRTWAMRMVPTFVAADPSNFRNALNRDTFEGAMAELSGRGMRLDDRVIARSPNVSPTRGKVSGDISKKLGDLGQDLTFTPIQPCRIVDTRLTSAGYFAAAETRSFFAMSANYTAQGGSSTDCGMLGVGASAVMLNVTAVTPFANGYATLYAFGTTRPNTSNINYSTGVTLANNTMTKVPNPLSSSDFSVYSSAASHYVIDVVGYFSPPQGTALECYNTGEPAMGPIAPNGGRAFLYAPNCPAGYTRVDSTCAVNDLVPGVSLTQVSISGCGGRNDTTQVQYMYASATCCRVPGR